MESKEFFAKVYFKFKNVDEASKMLKLTSALAFYTAKIEFSSITLEMAVTFVDNLYMRMFISNARDITGDYSIIEAA